jgi:hypothetical protein
MSPPADLPQWGPGTVAILSTGAGAPHAIPVSTGVRVGPQRILIALSQRRESLVRVRRDPRAALTLLTAGNVAITAHCRAEVLADPLPGIEGVVALVLTVEHVQDHGREDFHIEEAVRWRWTDPDAARRDAQVREALEALAAAL